MAEDYSDETLDQDASAFWAFSQALYGRDDVAKDCLYLQDHLGANVNLILYLCFRWRAHQSVLSPDDLAILGAGMDHYDAAILHPLRAVRRGLKPMIGDDPDLAAAYEALKAAELSCEKAQQRRLVASGRSLGARPCDGQAQAPLAKALEDHLMPLLMDLPEDFTPKKVLAMVARIADAACRMPLTHVFLSNKHA